MTRKKRLAGDARRASPVIAEIAASIEAWHKPATVALEAVLIPQLIVTLNLTQDGLQAELPGANGSRRVVALGDGDDFHDSCLRMLQAQVRRHVEIGLDGAPTERQVRHWEEHKDFADDRCPFCKSEGRVASRRGRERPYAVAAGDGSVTVRKVGKKRKPGLRLAGRTLEQLGL